VKGAPYSATALTETVQLLSDGNQITRRMEARIYRDSEGRTRRELTLDTLAKYAAGGDAPRLVFIDDPMAGLQFGLGPRTRTSSLLKGPVRLVTQVPASPREPVATEPRAKKIGTMEPKIDAEGKALPKQQKLEKIDLKGDKERLKETKDDLKDAKGD